MLLCRELTVLLCEDHTTYEHVQLHCLEAFSCPLSNPFHLLRQGSLRTFSGIHRSIIIHFEMQADDIGFSSCESQHPFASSAHDNWRVRELMWLREGFEISNVIMGASKS